MSYPASPAPSAPLREYPKTADAYELIEEVGKGVSATVWRAKCVPFNEMVAIKVLNLDNHDTRVLDEMRREVQTMRMMSHPNLVDILCCFVSQQELWLVMRYLAGGSALNLLKWEHQKGFDEPTIATIAKSVLQALAYCHKNQLIHRDIKSGNILLDTDGSVRLADFGVSASCWGSQDWSKHRTFIGTPCWMAPEVMDQQSGYDTAADIWSFGITILELAQGHAPMARLAPLKVLVNTIKYPPPELPPDSSGKHFSKALREMASLCLNKDPTKRPTASKLLEHRFLKEAKKKEFIVSHLLEGRPELGERSRILKEKEKQRRQEQGGGLDVTGSNVDAKELANRQEFARGVSAWDFNMEQMRLQADLEILPPVSEEMEVTMNSGVGANPSGVAKPPTVKEAKEEKGGEGGGGVNSAGELKRQPTKTKGRFDVYEEDDYGVDDGATSSATTPAATPSAMDRTSTMERTASTTSTDSIPENRNVPAAAATAKGPQVEAAGGSPRASSSTNLPTASKEAAAGAASRKGRFSIMREEVSSEGDTRQQVLEHKTQPTRISQHSEPGGTNAQTTQLMQLVSSQVLPQLQTLQAQHAAQQELIQSLVKQVIGGTGPRSPKEAERKPYDSWNEHELLTAMQELQARVTALLEENHQLKRRNKDLEHKLNSATASK